MSVNQWKVVNQLRDYISKLNDGSVQKELRYIVRRLPHLQKDILKYFEYGDRSASVEAETKTEPSRYNLPNVLESLKKKPEAPEVPKWKVTGVAVSKVRAFRDFGFSSVQKQP